MVVGGGIGGLAAARGLQSAGWDVQVLEQASRLEPLGAGISLWPNAVRALDALNVPVRDRAGPAGPGGVRTSSGQWLSRTAPQSYQARYGAPLIALHRAELQHVLLTRLMRHTVLPGAHVTHVKLEPDGVRVRHSQGEHRADLAVLADGLNSPTRHLVTGPDPQARYAGYTAWRGVTEPGADLPDLAATESWGRGERFGIVPLADGRAYWFATANIVEGEHAPDGEHVEVLRRFAGWHPPIERVVRATDPAGVLRHDVYDLRPHPTRYAHGRLLLLGDAAHAMTPNLGQGACQALEDAATLRVLITGRADLATAMIRYDELRRPRARAVAVRSRQVGRIGQLQSRRASHGRDLLMRTVPDWVTDKQLDATLAWQPPDS